MGVFLNDAVAIARQPNIVFAIGETTMDGPWNSLLGPSGIDEVAGGIENDH